jgi:uncharacterized protein YbaR (Trm112 family)/ubiquinone/menaquinone biosynthesis C-methylase UbiE
MELLVKYKDIFICPNCKTQLHLFNPDNILGFYCEKCELIFPIKEGIPIILANDIRKYSLEYPLLTEMLHQTTSTDVERCIRKTVELVESKKSSETWEWTDEKFWSEKYSQDPDKAPINDEKDRFWQRAPMLDAMLEDDGDFKDKTLLSLGCGDGNNFRSLIHPHCSSGTLYIAQDISYQGLVLNRKLNSHINSLYVLCSEDYELPFADESVDIIYYFGILHHTRHKSSNVKKDRRLLKESGYVFLHEALDRPKTFLAKKLEEEKSEHEEYINRQECLAQFSDDDYFKIIYKREDSTPFYTFFMLFFRDFTLSTNLIFNSIMKLDVAIAKTLGFFIPYFKPGCIALLARRKI